MLPNLAAAEERFSVLRADVQHFLTVAKGLLRFLQFEVREWEVEQERQFNFLKTLLLFFIHRLTILQKCHGLYHGPTVVWHDCYNTVYY